MIEEYRTTELTRANLEYAAARARLQSATTRKARQAAMHDVEFWGNKSDFLSNPAFVG